MESIARTLRSRLPVKIASRRDDGVHLGEVRASVLVSFGRQLRDFTERNLPADIACVEIVSRQCGPRRSDNGQATLREHES